MSDAALLAGVDGAKGGWLMVEMQAGDVASARARLVPDLSLVDAGIAVVDIPIGLPDAHRPSRHVDAMARARIGPRRSSVFSPPCREALAETGYDAANAAQRAATGKGLSKQAWAIAPKIREADAFVRGNPPHSLREGHPELAFTVLNRGVPMTAWKRKVAGAYERRDLLIAEGFPLSKLVRDLANVPGWAEDDLLDACVLVWTAGRCAAGAALCLPDESQLDAHGLPMEMWA